MIIEIKIPPEVEAALLGLLRLVDVAAHPPIVANYDPAVSSESREGFGQRVQHIRLARGLSQERLGAKAGFSRATIQNVELARSGVRSSTLVALAAALNCNPFWLMTGQGDPGFGLTEKTAE